MDTPPFQERLSSLTSAPSPPSGLRPHVCGTEGRGPGERSQPGATQWGPAEPHHLSGAGVEGFLPGERRYGCLAVGSI